MDDAQTKRVGTVTSAQRDTAQASNRPVSRWAIHRRIYDWVLSLAQTKHATWALFALSFAESSFFPVPPDVLLGPLCLGNRRKAWWFAGVCTLASVLGAIVGWTLGAGAWHATQDFWFNYMPGFSHAEFETVKAWYERWGVWVLFAAAFTPIPFKVFTIAAGVFAQPLAAFLLVAAIGRGMRFFIVAALFYWIGPKAVPFIDKYFNWLCIGFVALLVGGLALLKLL